MRISLAVVAALVLLMSGALSGALGSGPSLPDDGTTPLERDRTYAVLWDLSHGPYILYTPSGWYSDLVDALETEEIVSYETAMSLQYVDLEPYDMIVIGTLQAWDSAYTAAELTAIQGFVSGGGGLLILGENSGCPNEHVNLISEAYGVTCATEGNDFGSPVTNLAAVDIFEGVTAVSPAGGGSLSVSAPSDAVAWAPGGEPVVSLLGDCGVIAVGDGDFCMNDYIGDGDNQTFAINVFSCLCGADTPVEGVGWGAIKSLFR